MITILSKDLQLDLEFTILTTFALSSNDMLFGYIGFLIQATIATS
jgi:hypothetical protein